jgi:polysaccharide pyruvyl transferase WcaK-like protein
MKKVLVYGFYYKNNIGDQLFIDALHKLFPHIHFVFTDHIERQHLLGVDALFFGGGSFLDTKPLISDDAINAIKLMPSFYIGVGSETDIHPFHLELIKAAKLVAIRSVIKKEVFYSLNTNTIVIPDLVYSLSDCVIQSDRHSKSILILPNVSVVPQYFTSHWEHVFWEKFKIEFAQFLDILIDDRYSINLFGMCRDNELNDNFASAEIINKMRHRSSKYITDCEKDIASLTKLFSSYTNIITQRYHGTILSNMCKTPCLTIHHHDKLMHNASISYFEITKQKLIDAFYACTYNDIYVGDFAELVKKMNELL